MPMEQIEQLTKEYAVARAVLAERVTALGDEYESLKRRKIPGIKLAIAGAMAAQAELKAAIEAEPALFAKPRTRIFHGVKVGWQKAKGKLTFADAANVVKLIRRHFAEQFDVLVKTKETPVKDALLQLSAADLKKLGCEVSDAGDEVVIKPTDSEIDKLVDALLKDKSDSAEEEAA